MRPLAVDLCCKQGGASRGYELAGFDMLGVDCDPQPRYPYEFVQADALAFVADLITDGMRWLGRPVRLLAGSPPCRKHTRAQKIRGNDHPDIIAPMRRLMIKADVPYVIENVPGAPLADPVELCGSMFGLRTYRHRWFESNVPLATRLHPRHVRHPVKMGRALRPGDQYFAVGNFAGADLVGAGLGVEWMTRDGMRDCVPPAYTEFIGAQIAAHLGLVAA